MRLSASFEVLSGLIPFRSNHVLLGVASTILDGEVSTVTSLSQKYQVLLAHTHLPLNADKVVLLRTNTQTNSTPSTLRHNCPTHAEAVLLTYLSVPPYQPLVLTVACPHPSLLLAQSQATQPANNVVAGVNT